METVPFSQLPSSIQRHYPHTPSLLIQARCAFSPQGDAATVEMNGRVDEWKYEPRMKGGQGWTCASEPARLP